MAKQIREHNNYLTFSAAARLLPEDVQRKWAIVNQRRLDDIQRARTEGFESFKKA